MRSAFLVLITSISIAVLLCAKSFDKYQQLLLLSPSLTLQHIISFFSPKSKPTTAEQEEEVEKKQASIAEAKAFEGLTPEISIVSDDSEMSSVARARAIAKTFKAIEKSEGAGAKVRRSVGTQALRHFSPFLMLDHFTVGIGAGFPDHPHRGQETITYLLHGSVDHEDFAGHKGTIRAGDLQFMTAGRGIVHAEMPGKNDDGSPNVGLQLWVDLPQKLKYCEPRYRDLRAEEIPSVKADDGRVEIKIISGNSHGVDSVKDLAYTPVWILDVTMQPGGKLRQPLPKGWNAFAYTLEGDTIIFGEKTRVEAFYNVVFERDGDVVDVLVPDNAKNPARFVLIAGQPHDQKIIQYGPFVVSTPEEVYQAMLDYQSSSNGFERARGWQSEIGRSMLRS